MKIICSYQGKEVVRTLANDTVLLGRGRGADAPDVDLSPDIYVSRKHAVLAQNQGEWRLRAGDLIVLGETALRVETLPEISPAPAEAEVASQFQILAALDA